MSKHWTRCMMSAVAALSLGACAGSKSITIEQTFPTVVAQPREVRAVLVFDQAFRTFVAHPVDKVEIAIGTAQVELLSKAFRGLFTQVEVVSSRAEVPPGTDLVIVPSVREVQLSVPSESYLSVYEMWIKYALEIETGEGVPVDSWFLPAYGKTPDSMMLSRGSAIEEATIVALRDAGAKLLLDFYRIPAIHGWMQQHERAKVQS
jgi:hypothetical protein